jgi:hypothetical protein
MSNDAAVLEDARRELGRSMRDLWLDYFALGGGADLPEVTAFLGGETTPSDHDYDVLAVALNETYLDRGQHHPVPYSTPD